MVAPVLKSFQAQVSPCIRGGGGRRPGSPLVSAVTDGCLPVRLEQEASPISCSRIWFLMFSWLRQALISCCDGAFTCPVLT